VPAGVTWALSRPLVFVEEAAEHGPALNPLLGEIGYGVVGPGWLEAECAVRSSPVVEPGILGHHDAQVPFAEDQHPVGDLSPGGEHEPLRISVRARTPRRDLHGLDAGIGQDRVKRRAGRARRPGPGGRDSVSVRTITAPDSRNMIKP